MRRADPGSDMGHLGPSQAPPSMSTQKTKPEGGEQRPSPWEAWGKRFSLSKKDGILGPAHPLGGLEASLQVWTPRD